MTNFQGDISSSDLSPATLTPVPVNGSPAPAVQAQRLRLVCGVSVTLTPTLRSWRAQQDGTVVGGRSCWLEASGRARGSAGPRLAIWGPSCAAGFECGPGNAPEAQSASVRPPLRPQDPGLDKKPPPRPIGISMRDLLFDGWCVAVPAPRAQRPGVPEAPPAPSGLTGRQAARGPESQLLPLSPLGGQAGGPHPAGPRAAGV